MKKIYTIYTEGKVVVPARNEADSLHQDGYGSLDGDVPLLSLSPCETLYLLERTRISVIDEKSRDTLVFQQLLLKFSDVDDLIWTRYLVYRDMRSRGFLVKEGLELGVDFLVYERGSHGKKPPKYIVYAIREGATEKIGHLRQIMETVESSGRVLRLAVVDRRSEIVYYTLSEMEFRKPSSVLSKIEKDRSP